MKVMLIEDAISSSSILFESLIQEGHDVLVRIIYTGNLFRKASEINPDLIVINVVSTDEKTLSQLRRINEICPKPIVIFSQKGDSKIINSAIDAGVSAFIVDGLAAQRVQSVLEVARARFHNYSKLRTELEKTKETLANRKIIEKAKGLIMRQKHCTEDEAYGLLRTLAMDRNQKLVDVANNLIEVSSLLI